MAAPAEAAITDSIRFFFVDSFPPAAAPPESAAASARALEMAVAALAAFHGIGAPATDDFSAFSDPLRIPDPFGVSGNHSAEFFERATSRLAQYGISFSVFFPADFAEAEQTAAQAVVRGHPVLALHPRPFVLFGYDYREPDPFWYVQRFPAVENTEILTRSQWREEWWLWEADPASVALLEVTGRDSIRSRPPDPEQVLESIITAAKTDTATGATSYIRPVLRVLDSLAKAVVPPQFVNPPEDPRDPLCLRRAETQRVRFQQYLKALLPQARDSTVKQSLRLAIYSCGKAAEAFGTAAGEMYGRDEPKSPEDSVTVLDIMARRWVEHRLEAAKYLSDALRWERQMLAAIKDVTGAKRPFRR